MGRPKGTVNRLTMEAREFARTILDSEEYQASIRERIVARTLPPAIEVALLHYRYGKPSDTLDVFMHEEDLSKLTDEQLKDKLLALSDELRRDALAEDEPPSTPQHPERPH